LRIDQGRRGVAEPCRNEEEPVAYVARIADGELAERLRSAGAVLIEGPKACGKTETARQKAVSEVRLDTDAQAREAAEVAPELILDRDPPVLLDEWQQVPSLWNQVRRAVDDRQQAGQFILTGSATPSDDVTRHSGAGRFSVMRMRPMTLAESGHSTAAVSLRALLNGKTQNASDAGLTIPKLADLVTVGGWPGWQGSPTQSVSRAARDYLTQVSHIDVSAVEGHRRDPKKVDALLRSLARNISTEVTVKTLAGDTAGAEETMDRDTASAYLAVLERLMVVENQPAWAPAMRSRAQLRSSPKRHFVDPSLAVAALHGSPAKLLADLESLGFLFESLVVRDLRVLSQPLDGQVLHYRDNKGLEVDAVVTCDDGRWGAFEVKLGQRQVDDAAENLLEFGRKIDATRCGDPGVLAVVTATGLAYRRRDGVHVVPIGTLGP
jgi:predicted AAA+ superfamily ATPase